LEEYLRNSQFLRQIHVAVRAVGEPCNSCGYREGCLHCLAINYVGKEKVQFGFDGCPMSAAVKEQIALAEGIPLPFNAG